MRRGFSAGPTRAAESGAACRRANKKANQRADQAACFFFGVNARLHIVHRQRDTEHLTGLFRLSMLARNPRKMADDRNA